ncbi:hypothetical protein MCOR13_005375 [Pyricularia oryzae]|nr:hypothetical protein MCOR13_005375 [Pyricularia oryzae]
MACKGIRIGPRYGSKGSYLTQAWVGRCRSPEWLMLRRGRCCVASKGKSPIGITGSHRMYCVLPVRYSSSRRISRPNPPSRETLERLIWSGQQGPPSHSRWRGEPPSRVSPVLEQPARGQISADP